MATIKKRINVSVSKEIEYALKQSAARDDVPQATKAAELIGLALELEEDRAFAHIVRRRKGSAGTLTSHADAWA